MSDYLGPLTLVSGTGTYVLKKWTTDGPTASLEINVCGATANAIATATEALVAQCQQGNSYAHFTPGLTAPVVYRITGMPAFSLDPLVSISSGLFQKVQITLNLAGTPAGALTTLYNAQNLSTPSSVALSALLGTQPTLLDVTIDDAAGTDMHSVWAAIAPTALSDSKWLVLASALTWTTMSNGTGATMWGNTSRYTTSASYQTANLDTSQYPTGKYRLLARVQQSSGTGWVKGSQLGVSTEVAVTRTTPHLLVIGDVDLPVSDTLPGVASNLTLSVRSDATNTLTVNAFVLLPLDMGYFSWHHDVTTTEIDQLDVGPTGVYMDGAYDATYLQGGPLRADVLAAHVGSLVATASPTGNTWPTDWGRTDTATTADTNRFKITTSSSTKYAWYAATNIATPIIVPGAWYEFSYTRQVTVRTSGTAQAQVTWLDVDGNAVRTDNFESISAVDGSPVACIYYAKAPTHAVRCQQTFMVNNGTVTVYYSAAVFRRCPLRLIVVAEDAAGALTSYAHPVSLTVKYTPRYQIMR